MHCCRHPTNDKLKADKLPFMRPLLLLVSAIIMSALGRDAAAQTEARANQLTTRSGVYTSAQATRGRDVYAGNCKSCHTPEFHTSPAFTAKWNRRALSELYVYIRDLMPKNEPGTLSPEENADVLAYMLRMNRMPAGPKDLPADSAALQSIRIETPPLPVRKEP